MRDSQASQTIPLPIEFSGEYSRDNKTWQPLSKDAHLNALHNDLYLRSHFGSVLSGKLVMMHLDHIYYSISLNGEPVAGYIPRTAFAEPAVCGNEWTSWNLDDLSVDDLVEIHFSNPHTAGNALAHSEFLLCCSVWLWQPVCRKHSL
ncbi:MAG: hypothetical protein EOM64_02015 [Erysipelotrichia bacterium]|nr:hypothetical protein [Erysipelotrichia bacterium]